MVWIPKGIPLFSRHWDSWGPYPDSNPKPLNDSNQQSWQSKGTPQCHVETPQEIAGLMIRDYENPLVSLNKAKPAINALCYFLGFPPHGIGSKSPLRFPLSNSLNHGRSSNRRMSGWKDWKTHSRCQWQFFRQFTKSPFKLSEYLQQHQHASTINVSLNVVNQKQINLMRSILTKTAGTRSYDTSVISGVRYH